jgi:uncharacterized protein YjbI with pentapeptide repeats
MEIGVRNLGLADADKEFTLDVRAATLARASLVDADLSFAKAAGVDFRLANLKRAKLRSTQLENANFSGADLTDADFSGANLKKATLKECNLSGTIFADADLSGADLSGSTGLTFEAIQSAKGNNQTVLPTGIEKPLHWGLTLLVD